MTTQALATSVEIAMCSGTRCAVCTTFGSLILSAFLLSISICAGSAWHCPTSKGAGMEGQLAKICHRHMWVAAYAKGNEVVGGAASVQKGQGG